jgi:hypothetical protein
MTEKTDVVSIDSSALFDLIEGWKNSARKQFECADKTRKEEKNEMGARLVEHGATCYANCVMSIEKLINESND